MVRNKWEYKNKEVSRQAAFEAARKYNIPFILAVVMMNRNIPPAQFKEFLLKSKKSIKHPSGLKDMDKAVDRIVQAVENNEKIVVYGDYDVDGITSTSLLYDFLQSVGADVTYYIPDRMDEGYGINIKAITRFIKEGINLVVTVDCGITAVGEVDFAKCSGLDVIITDHHTCKEEIPAAAAVVNPKRHDDTYPFKGLAGVGVAFKLVLATAIRMGLNTGECFDKYVDLAAIGTVADVMDLKDENRVIVEKGLEQIRKLERPGVKALLESAGALSRPITSTTIAFAVAPRLNAAGRIGSALKSVELMLEKDEEKARVLAEELDSENELRKQTEQNIYNEALAMIASDPNFDKKKVIVLAKEDWHQGVIGIVASKLLEDFYKPCILISLDRNGRGKGSGRSIRGFSLFEALTVCDKHLINFGGHAAAAGLGILKGNIKAFETEINKYADKVLKPENMVKVIEIDSVLDKNSINLQSVKQLSYLEPFGMGNEQPVFVVKSAVIENVSACGEEKNHLRMTVSCDGLRISCIGFRKGEWADVLTKGDRVHLAFNLDINSYQGVETVQFKLIDIKQDK